MKKIKLLFAWTAILLTLVAGCATTSSNPQEHTRIMEASKRVLARHNLIVQESRYREGTLVAVSRVNGDFLSKARVKVLARVIENDEGYLEPSVRVFNQMDHDMTTAWGPSHYQVGEKWVNLRTNAAMEAQLYNEIMDEMGQVNLYQGKAWKPAEPARQAPPAPKEVPLSPYNPY